MDTAEAAARLQGYAAKLAALVERAERDLALEGALGVATREAIGTFVSALSADLSVLYQRGAAHRLTSVERDVLLPVVEAIRVQLRGIPGFKEPGTALLRLRTAVGLATAPGSA